MDERETAELSEIRVRVERLEREVAKLRGAAPAQAVLETTATRPVPAASAPPPPPPPFANAVAAPAPRSLESRLGSQVFNRIAIVLC